MRQLWTRIRLGILGRLAVADEVRGLRAAELRQAGQGRDARLAAAVGGRAGVRAVGSSLLALQISAAVMAVFLAGTVGWLALTDDGYFAGKAPLAELAFPPPPRPAAISRKTPPAPAGGTFAGGEPAQTTVAALAPQGALPRSQLQPVEKSGPLAAVPDPDLVIQSEHGWLPVISPDGRQSWRVYARPFETAEDRPLVGIMVGSLGLSQSATLAAIQQLPGSITLGFNPYAPNLQDWINQARAAGHEVMLQLPMEPFDYPANDPGPHTLLTSLEAEANIERTECVLSRFVGYVGVTNYMGSRFTTSAGALRPVLDLLKYRGLMFLDSRASAHSVVGRMAREMGLVEASNSRFVNVVASRGAIDERLNELEVIAKAGNAAIGIGFPYPVTIERLAGWAAGLGDRGIALAPISVFGARSTAARAQARVTPEME